MLLLQVLRGGMRHAGLPGVWPPPARCAASDCAGASAGAGFDCCGCRHCAAIRVRLLHHGRAVRLLQLHHVRPRTADNAAAALPDDAAAAAAWQGHTLWSRGCRVPINCVRALVRRLGHCVPGEWMQLYGNCCSDCRLESAAAAGAGQLLQQAMLIAVQALSAVHLLTLSHLAVCSLACCRSCAMATGLCFRPWAPTRCVAPPTSMA